MAEWGATETVAWGDGQEDATTIASDHAEIVFDTTIADNGLKEEKKIWRIRKNEIEELQTERYDGVEKFVTIFKRTGKGRALEVYRENFPRKALTVFSEVWKKEIDREGNTALLIIDDASGNMLPYNLILNWIELCIQEGNDIKFPEIEEGLNQLHVLLDVITVANYIQIPGKSLQEPLKKVAIRYARKNLIDIDYVARLYDTADPDYDGGDRLLQEAAAASIFEAWWKCKLDQPEFDEYCSHVADLRAEFGQLDADINACVNEKKDFLEKKRDERRAKFTANPTVSVVPDVVAASDGADGGWGNAATEAAATDNEWAAADVTDAAKQPTDSWTTGGDTDGW